MFQVIEYFAFLELIFFAYSPPENCCTTKIKLHVSFGKIMLEHAKVHVEWNWLASQEIT
jgi:hypothetical protein